MGHHHGRPHHEGAKALTVPSANRPWSSALEGDLQLLPSAERRWGALSLLGLQGQRADRGTADTEQRPGPQGLPRPTQPSVSLFSLDSFPVASFPNVVMSIPAIPGADAWKRAAGRTEWTRHVRKHSVLPSLQPVLARSCPNCKRQA